MQKDKIRNKFVMLLMQKGFGVEGATIAADHLTANDMTVQEWISVKERLPEDSRSVILCTRSRIVGVGFYSKTTRNWVQHYSGGGIYVDVTHWMPLPEPPKGVE